MDSSDSSGHPARAGVEAGTIFPALAGSGIARGWRIPGEYAALLGGGLAVVSTALLPLHFLGGGGVPTGIGFGLAGLVLAAATLAIGAGSRLPRRMRSLQSWALLGAAGFAVSGLGLVADLLDWPIVASEVVAVIAVVAWWLAIGTRLLGAARDPEVEGFYGQASVLGWASLACAALAAVAVLAQLFVPTVGGVPARMAYVLWGPWGLIAGRALRRTRRTA